MVVMHPLPRVNEIRYDEHGVVLCRRSFEVRVIELTLNKHHAQENRILKPWKVCISVEQIIKSLNMSQNYERP